MYFKPLTKSLSRATVPLAGGGYRVMCYLTCLSIPIFTYCIAPSFILVHSLSRGTVIAAQMAIGHRYLKKGSLPNTLPFLRVDCLTDTLYKICLRYLKRVAYPTHYPFSGSTFEQILYIKFAFDT